MYFLYFLLLWMLIFFCAFCGVFFLPFPFSPTIRKRPLWCAWWRGPFSLRWWHTTSISSRPFAYTMCQVNSKLHAGITSHGFFKSFLCLVEVTRWYSATRTNMWDKMTIYNSISSSFPASGPSCLLGAAKCKIRTENCFLWSPFSPSLPISGLALCFQGWMGFL